MMKTRMYRLLAPVLAVGVIGGGAWFWQSSCPREPGNELVLYGNADIRQVELAFNGRERITSMLAQEGDEISKDQLLATLDTKRMEYDVARAEAQAQSQKEVVAGLEAGNRPEEIREARANVEAAEAKERDAERTYKRVVLLLPSHAAAQQQADDAKASMESAQAQVKVAKAALDLAMAGPRKEDIAAAKATLMGYEAELSLAKRELEETNLYAPSDGVIQNRILEVGDMASPLKPVYTVALTDPVWVRTYVTETDLGRISSGMTAEVTTDSYPDKRYDAWIGFISPTAEFTPKPVQTAELRSKLVYEVRVYVRNPHNELRLGMPATVKIRLDQSRTAPREPANTDAQSENDK